MLTMLDDQTSKQPSDTKTGLEVGTPEEPPPTYSPPSTSVANENEDCTQTIPTNTKPTNFLLLANEHDAIRGDFVIDPSLRIPSSMLSPLDKDGSEDDRKNLCLRSRHSSVQAQIWLLARGGGDTDTPRRTSIELASNHGSIRAQLHAVDATPFVLHATAPHGSVKLGIPRGFTGLLLLSTRHGNVTISEGIKAHVTQLSQLGDMRRYFVGDFGLLGEVWEKSQIEAESTHGSVKVRYVDEGLGKKGFFSRLFGT